MKKKYLVRFIIFLFFNTFLSLSLAIEVPIYDFSIKAYPQNSNYYISPTSKDYSTSLLKPEYQAAQLEQFYNHYYATDPIKGLSPWSESLVRSILPLVQKLQLENLIAFDNQNKDFMQKHYGENFKEQGENWLTNIRNNMDINRLESLVFNEENRAIAINNTLARVLPESAPDFFHFSLAGQGFPFDNLQESAVWAGTPLYIISMSNDKVWSLVLTPDAYFAWVKNNDIASVSSEFISQWQTAAQKGLVAITKTAVSITDSQQHTQFTGYIGAVFPLVKRNEQETSFLIPGKNHQHQAEIIVGFVNKNAASQMPMTASKKNMVKIIKQLQNRPYGWGGAYFFNDCSQELKSLFTPFGIWLPRNAAQQAELSPSLDLSKNSIDERISLLKKKGHPLMTIVYIGSHVMLYIGNKDRGNNELEIITYQNRWGLSPKNGDKRYVIGQSLFFPLLKYYPENPDAGSLVDKSYFKLIFLDELETHAMLAQQFVKKFSNVIFAKDL